ncbi:hypothetical protein RB213_015925 [Colletotrichum asianum]
MLHAWNRAKGATPSSRRPATSASISVTIGCVRRNSYKNAPCHVVPFLDFQQRQLLNRWLARQSDGTKTPLGRSVDATVDWPIFSWKL